ncbi:olfactory receptor class A-like protein 1 [Pleurodeles waltl]|uniref:olfactory receptor class A-like protein 1 n=1 Tax=Pleurodeles waltl TaxID=8319 RepID=UPI00370953BF
MDAATFILGLSFLVQLVGGSLGNLTLLLSYVHLKATQGILRPVDIIVSHLALANLLALLSRGFPQIMSLFGMKNFMTDSGCKTVIYLYRVARGLSISTTCILSVFQSITMAPITTWLGKLKHRIPKYLIPSFIVFWIVGLFSFLVVPLYARAPQNSTFPPNVVSLGFCYMSYLPPGSVQDIVSTTFIGGQDMFLVTVMIIASVYMLVVLRRHRKQVEYIQSVSQSSTTVVEDKASKTIIELVALYASFYAIDIIINEYGRSLQQQTTLLTNIRVFFSSCYQLLSPFILLSFNKKVALKNLCKKKKKILSANNG